MIRATPIEAIETFTRAEDYHQKYYLRATSIVYDELALYYDTDRDFVDSTAAARLNGYLGGDGTMARFDGESDQLGLSEDALEVVRQRVEATDASCNTE